MVIPLLTLLAIALVITIAGLLLTPRGHMSGSSSEQHGISFTQRRRKRSASVNAYHDDYDSDIVDTRRHISQPNRRASRTSGEYTTSSSLNAFNTTKSYERLQTPQVSRSLISFPGLPGTYAPWIGVLLILLSLFVLGLYSLHNLLPDNALIINDQWPDVATAASPPTASKTDLQFSQLFPGTIGASQNLKRISQLDPAQYASTTQFNTWAYSACSAAAMTEVINAYGHSYDITSILTVEASLNQITPQLGLLSGHGIDLTVAHFGFKTYWPSNPTLDEIIQIGNSGRPVMVGFPPSRWNGGHLLVVRGGNSQDVFLADSSSYNMTSLTRQQFMKYWAGFAVVITPVQQTVAIVAPPKATSSAAPEPASAMNASQHVVRIAQNDPQQYSSTAQLNDWSTVDSSAVVMTEIINAYGHSYHVADILQEEIAIGGIDPSLGLLSANGITETVAHLGFTATILPLMSPTAIVQLANNGEPVIISYPPSRWPGGHLMIVTGGNSNSISLVDSSQQDIRSTTYQDFEKYWGGFAVVIKPN